MSTVVRFPQATPAKGLQRVQATYTLKEISRQFGLSESLIRRWAKEGVIHPVESSADGGLCFDFHALETFRRAREMRAVGMSARRIEAELHGQLSLFPENDRQGRLIPLPVRISPFEEALILHENGDPRAAEMYSKAIKEGESVADAYCNLGILNYEAQNIPGAFDNFTNALRHDPRHFESHFNLAHIYFESGDVRLARLHYDISAIIEPGNASVHFNLGLLNAVDGNIPAAIASLDKAKEFATETELGQIEEILAGLKSGGNSGAHGWPMAAVNPTDNLSVN